MNHLIIDLGAYATALFLAGVFYRRVVSMENIARDISKNHLPHINKKLGELGERLSHIEGRLHRG